jgi:hypothetical protein
MKPMLRSVLAVLGMLILTGCAFTKATLDVGLSRVTQAAARCRPFRR